MIFKTRHFVRWARKSGLADSLLFNVVIEMQGGLLELATLKKLAKDLLGLTAPQIAVAIREGSLLEVEHEKQEV